MKSKRGSVVSVGAKIDSPPRMRRRVAKRVAEAVGALPVDHEDERIVDALEHREAERLLSDVLRIGLEQCEKHRRSIDLLAAQNARQGVRLEAANDVRICALAVLAEAERRGVAMEEADMLREALQAQRTAGARVPDAYGPEVARAVHDLDELLAENARLRAALHGQDAKEIANDEDPAEARRHHAQVACAVAIGFNQMALDAKTLGEKVWCRLMRDESVKTAKAHGVEIRWSGEPPATVCTLDMTGVGGALWIAFREDDIEQMRACVAEHDAKTWADRPTPEDEAIAAAFPTRSGRHDTYREAARLVGDRHSKAALVALVNWLLVRIEDARKVGP